MTGVQTCALPICTRTVFNGEWFEMMTFEQVMKLNARVTLQQMMQREDFRARFDAKEAVRLHELQYPIMQGWDSVMIRADVELGGTDQLFNILVGRDLQREEGQCEQVVFLLPLLEGLDGVQKMSKSFGNYVGVNEPPVGMFGKLMSISDELMARYYTRRSARRSPRDIRWTRRSNSRGASSSATTAPRRGSTRWMISTRAFQKRTSRTRIFRS